MSQMIRDVANRLADTSKPLPEGYPSINEWQEWLSKCKHKETI